MWESGTMIGSPSQQVALYLSDGRTASTETNVSCGSPASANQRLDYCQAQRHL